MSRYRWHKNNLIGVVREIDAKVLQFCSDLRSDFIGFVENEPSLATLACQAGAMNRDVVVVDYFHVFMHQKTCMAAS